jgi:hypothetical protein
MPRHLPESRRSVSYQCTGRSQNYIGSLLLIINGQYTYLSASSRIIRFPGSHLIDTINGQFPDSPRTIKKLNTFRNCSCPSWLNRERTLRGQFWRREIRVRSRWLAVIMMIVMFTSRVVSLTDVGPLFDWKLRTNSCILNFTVRLLSARCEPDADSP